jgi:hypothetical protein
VRQSLYSHGVIISEKWWCMLDSTQSFSPRQSHYPKSAALQTFSRSTFRQKHVPFYQFETQTVRVVVEAKCRYSTEPECKAVDARTGTVKLVQHGTTVQYVHLDERESVCVGLCVRKRVRGRVMGGALSQCTTR